MNRNLLQAAESLIRASFVEDLGEQGDITTDAVCNRKSKSHARIVAKSCGVVAGLDFARLAFHLTDATIKYRKKLKDAAPVTSGQVLVEIFGTSNAVLKAERTALNIIGHLSGIASLTSLFVEKVKDTHAVILDTRKTLPGWRLLEKYAVHCGGGMNHRMGLYDMFLIKDNHIVAAGSLPQAVRHCRDYMKKRRFHAGIEVEATTFAQVQEAVNLRVDRIMLDNMKPAMMRKCVLWVNHRIPLEASGGVNDHNIRQIARTGVDFISVGAITHSAKQFDVSLDFL
jgi:nicotinate-nucleotide pyrophosphorylase (carboxylating)